MPDKQSEGNMRTPDQQPRYKKKICSCLHLFKFELYDSCRDAGRGRGVGGGVSRGSDFMSSV